MSKATIRPAKTTPAATVKPKPAARSRTAARTSRSAAAQPAGKQTASGSAATAAKKPVRRTTVAVTPAPARQTPAALKKKDKPAKAKKAKLVRDSFTMPETEYAAIAVLKKRCLEAGVAAKKSEILRAAVAGLAKLSDASVVAAIRRLEAIKTGRPAKGSK